MKVVWIVMNGESNEGGTVEGIYSTKKIAIRNALLKECHFGGGWMLKEESEDYIEWENGCDFLTVSKEIIK